MVEPLEAVEASGECSKPSLCRQLDGSWEHNQNDTWAAFAACLVEGCEGQVQLGFEAAAVHGNVGGGGEGPVGCSIEMEQGTLDSVSKSLKARKSQARKELQMSAGEGKGRLAAAGRWEGDQAV